MTEFLMSVFKGQYPYFAIPALFVIVYRIKRKYWTSTETILLLFVLFHTLIEAFQVLAGARVLYMSRRYLLPCAPILFGWCAWGIVHFITSRAQKIPSRIKYILIFAAFLLAAVLLFDGARPVMQKYTSSKKGHEKKIVKKLASRIKSIELPDKETPITIRKDYYTAPYQAVLYTEYPALAYWGKCRHAKEPDATCDILVLKSDQKLPEGFKILFTEKIDKAKYNICIQKRK